MWKGVDPHPNRASNVHPPLLWTPNPPINTGHPHTCSTSACLSGVRRCRPGSPPGSSAAARPGAACLCPPPSPASAAAAGPAGPPGAAATPACALLQGCDPTMLLHGPVSPFLLPLPLPPAPLAPSVPLAAPLSLPLAPSAAATLLVLGLPPNRCSTQSSSRRWMGDGQCGLQESAGASEAVGKACNDETAEARASGHACLARAAASRQWLTSQVPPRRCCTHTKMGRG